jgi:hypothetical protein
MILKGFVDSVGFIYSIVQYIKILEVTGSRECYAMDIIYENLLMESA